MFFAFFKVYDVCFKVHDDFSTYTMSFKLTIFFSERSTRIVHAAAEYFYSRRIKLSCDVGFTLFIWYDSVDKTFVIEDDASQVQFSSIVELLCCVLGNDRVDVFDITSIYGTKLCDFEEFGDANTALHSCFFGIVLTLRQKTVRDDRRGTALDAAAPRISGTVPVIVFKLRDPLR